MARGFRRIVGRGFVVATVVAVGAVTLGAGPAWAAESAAQPAKLHTRAVGQIPNGFDGPVTSVAVGADGTQYVGGGFTRWGPQTGGAVVDPTTGALNTSFPPISGTVSAAVSDGSGGFYIGGSFSTVLGQPRRNLAHLNADGSLTAWNPGATWSGGYDYVS